MDMASSMQIGWGDKESVVELALRSLSLSLSLSFSLSFPTRGASLGLTAIAGVLFVGLAMVESGVMWSENRMSPITLFG